MKKQTVYQLVKFKRRLILVSALFACTLPGHAALAQKLVPPPPPVLMQSAPPPPPMMMMSGPAPVPSTDAYSAGNPVSKPTLQPFICDEDGAGTGTSQFISSIGHLWLQMAISDKSNVEVGVSFNNVSGQPLSEILVDLKGDLNNTFGPWLVLSYRLPTGKIAGRVVSFSQAKSVSGAPEGFNRIAFTGNDLGLPPGTIMRAMEIMAIGENASGSITVGDVTVNGITAGKLMNTQTTCDFVP